MDIVNPHSTKRDETMQRKAIKKGQNSKGKVYAVVTDGITFEVWALCENYDAKVHGGISKSWRYVQKGMSESDAMKVFNKRVSA